MKERQCTVCVLPLLYVPAGSREYAGRANEYVQKIQSFFHSILCHFIEVLKNSMINYTVDNEGEI